MKKYKCPKCGMEYKEPGQCEMCGIDLKKTKIEEGEEMEKHDHTKHHKMMMEDFKRRFWVSLVLSLPVIVLSPLIQSFLGYELSFFGDKFVLFVFSSIIFFYGGWPFLEGIYKELKTKQPGMMTLIALAITVAFVYSSAVVFGLRGKVFFWELVTLIDVMLLGHWLEMRSVIGAGKALEDLAKLIPAKAHLIKDEKVKEVPVEELKKGNVVLIKPGEKIPADGQIIEGETNVNEAMLTGESKPVSKKEGEEVIGGSVNGNASIKVKVTKTGEDSYLSQVIDIVKKAQASKSKTQNLADKAAKWLTIISISVGVLTFIAWLIFGDEFVFAIERMVTVMVITCPHALGLAIPLVVAVSTSISAQKGLLIRNRNPFEEAREVDIVIFDKTGTLTEGEFGVSEVVSLGRYKERDILSYAASLEQNSEHSIAQGIMKKVEEEGINLNKVKNFENIPGKGVKGEVKGNLIKVVGQNYLKEKEEKVRDEKIRALLEKGETMVYVLKEEELIGAISLGDKVRKESKEAVERLKKEGVKCMMMTGDNKRVAKRVAEELGLDDYFAEVLPDEKYEKIKGLQEKGMKVAMVGDGVNDAPALTQADVGIAIGAGTDVAIESGDIVLVENDPLDVVSVLNLSKATYSKMKQNLFWATGYNVVAIPLAAGVLYSYGIVLSPAIGALLMSLSTVIVAVNAKFISV